MVYSRIRQINCLAVSYSSFNELRRDTIFNKTSCWNKQQPVEVVV